jgi:hypothetical protein
MSHRLLLTTVVGLLVTGPSLSSQVASNNQPSGTDTTYGLLIRPNVGSSTFAAAAAPARPSMTRAVELKGVVRIGGRAASNVRLTFHHNQGGQRVWRARIKSDGTYRIKLKGGDRHVICARIERNRPLNSHSNCRRFSAGVHRLDFDLPPGVIRVEVPPFRRRVSPVASVRVEGAHGGAGRSFRSAKGFRGDYFAADVGTYVVTITDPEHEEMLASWPVTITADEPVVGVKLAISRKSVQMDPARGNSDD